MKTGGMGRTIILIVAALACFFEGKTEAWSPRSQPDVSRKVFVDGLVAGMIGSVILPERARADVTNKVASTSALRKLKRAQKQLGGLSTVAAANDFLEVKAFLRTPPFDDVRKVSFTLVRGGEDGPKAEELQVKYKSFTASLEKIDGTSSLGIRGRKIPQLQLSEEYLVVESAMNEFVKVAEEAVEIPVQYED